MICPNCGAEIEVFKNGYGICSFCGSKVEIDLKNKVSDNQLIIPFGTIEIKNSEYKNNRNLVTVIIPDTVQYIGESAFENCERLEEVNIPRSIRKIGNYAFKNTGLKSLNIPNSIEQIGKEAFMDCNNLTDLFIEPEFNYSLNQTFKKCSNLNNVQCNLYDFYPSLIRGTETHEKKDSRSTFFDAFQGTEFYYKIFDAFQKSYNSGVCFLCGGTIKKPFIGYHQCQKCGCDYSMIRSLK